MTEPQANELMSRYFEHQCSAEELARLMGLLGEDPALRHAFLREALVRVEMHDWAGQQLAHAQRPPLRTRPSRRIRHPGRWRIWAAVAATLVLCTGTWLAQQMLDDRHPQGRLSAATGMVQVVSDGQTRDAVVGQELPPGMDIICRDSESGATLGYDDGTAISLAGNTRLGVLPGSGKRLTLQEGSLTAQVAPQPADTPLLILTPQAEAVVVGTILTLTIADQATRLEVSTGRVRLTDVHDRSRHTEVSSGQSATVTPGAALVPQSLTQVEPVAPQFLIDGHEQGLQWQPNEHSDPCAFAITDEHAHSGAHALRIAYEHRPADHGYASLLHPLRLGPSDSMLRCWVYIASSGSTEKASLNLQLISADGGAWFMGHALLQYRPRGIWFELRVPVRTPLKKNGTKGQDRYDPNTVVSVLLGIYGGSATVLIDDLELLPAQSR